MALSAEHHAKLKEHVKSKLIEIGAYVDDQLPDYVMIMVTNKKSEKQMVEDLDLFLGGTESAVKFVEWLNTEIKRVSSPSTASPAASSKPKSAVSRKSSATNNQSSSHESDELAIQVEADEFNEDFGEEKSRQRQKTTNAPEAAKLQQASEPEKRHEAPAEVKRTPSSSLQSRVGAVINRDQTTSDSTTSTSNRRHRQDSRDEETTRDRHQHQHNDHDDRDNNRDDDDEHDDGYRRKRKLSSSLSSVVKVSERKYAVPRAMQPNKNILLNAVQAANTSVSSNASASSKASSKSIADLKLEELRAKRKSLPSNDREETAAAANEPASSGSKRMRTSYSTSVVSGAGGHGYDGDKRKAVIDENSDKRVSNESSLAAAKDSRKVQIETNDSALKALDTNNRELQQQAEPKFIVTLNGLDEEKLAAANQQQQRSVSNTSKAGGLFANRLGPVNHVDDEDDDMLDGDVITAGEEMDLLDEEFADHHNGGDEKMDNENTDEQVQKKKLTRCVFWPQCEKGDQCAYLHPNKPCTTFPNCPFGQQCHFLHPRCRYDGFCTRLDCPFVHMTKKPTPSAPMVAKMNIAVPLGGSDDAGNEPTSMDATVSAPTGKSITPKITINKIQPIYNLVNKPPPAVASTEPAAESEEKPASGGVGGGEPVAMATPAVGQLPPSFAKAPKYRHHTGAGGGAFYRPNHFSFVNRPTTSIPINCKFGALCKNLKCPYIHPSQAAQKQQSQFKWTASSSSSQPAKTNEPSNVAGSVEEATAIANQPQQQQQVIIS